MNNYTRIDTDANGSKYYYNENGKIHRIDGPAVEYFNGRKEWCVNGELHRLDGPAIDCHNGHKYWYANDKPHRIDGPAVEYANGRKYWFINGINYTEEEFNKKQSKDLNWLDHYEYVVVDTTTHYINSDEKR